MSLRILLLDTGKEWGGGTNSMFELLKRIDRTRFDVTALFYRNYRKGETSDLRTELSRIGIALEIEPPQRQPVWAKLSKELIRGLCLPWPGARRRLLHAVEHAWRIRPSAKRLAARLRAGHYDLLYMNNQPSSNLEGYLAAEMAGIPVIQHCRSNAVLVPAEVAIVNRLASRLICVSAGIRESLVAQGVRDDLCTVVYNAIDVDQSLPAAVSLSGTDANDVIIGSVGSLLPRKANDHLLSAAAKLVEREDMRNFHLLLVGDGPERGRLEAQATQSGLAQYVTFAGFQCNPLAWQQAMDIVVLASSGEGFPRVILEAMLLGKTVIASDVVGSRELVEDGINGLLYPYGDVEALVACLQRLLESPDLRARLGKAGRDRVRRKHAIAAYIGGVEKQLLRACETLTAPRSEPLE